MHYDNPDAWWIEWKDGHMTWWSGAEVKATYWKLKQKGVLCELLSSLFKNAGAGITPSCEASMKRSRR